MMKSTKIQEQSYDHVRIAGDAGNDLVDVYRLTCLEQGIEFVSWGENPTNSMNPTNPITSKNTKTKDLTPQTNGLSTLALGLNGVAAAIMETKVHPAENVALQA
jgi:hypothetical protein